MEYIDALERHLVIEDKRIELHLPLFEFFPQMGKYKLLEILRRLVTTSEFQIVLWEKLHKETDFDKSVFLFISPEDISMKDEINMFVNYNAIVDIRDIIDEVGELCDAERESIVYDIQDLIKDSVKDTLHLFEGDFYDAINDSSDDVMEMYENIDNEEE